MFSIRFRGRIPILSFPPTVWFSSYQALGSEFDGPCDPREGDHGFEGRSDVYSVVTEAVGLKRRVRSFIFHLTDRIVVS